MIKMVNLLKRKPGMSMEKFIKYYETVHSKIGEKYLARHAVRYVRRYLHPLAQGLDSAETARNYDVIMEAWFPDQKAFEGFFAEVATPEVQAEIREDEEKLFDRNYMDFYMVEEHESDLGK